jgi:hypothetical protein
MDIIIERACGMDIHKDSITACVMTPEGKEIQTFSTKTVFLLQLIDCQLLRHGLLKASFIPNRNQRELRELVRYRRSIIEEQARQHNRIQKVLEGANIKLGSVVSDIMGVSSKEMLHAIADGEEDPEKLANFARRSMKKKKEELELVMVA